MKVRSIPFMTQFGACELPNVPSLAPKRKRTDTRPSRVRIRTRRDFNRTPAQYTGSRPWAISPTGD